MEKNSVIKFKEHFIVYFKALENAADFDADFAFFIMHFGFSFQETIIKTNDSVIKVLKNQLEGDHLTLEIKSVVKREIISLQKETIAIRIKMKTDFNSVLLHEVYLKLNIALALRVFFQLKIFGGKVLFPKVEGFNSNEGDFAKILENFFEDNYSLTCNNNNYWESSKNMIKEVLGKRESQGKTETPDFIEKKEMFFSGRYRVAHGLAFFN